MEGCGFCFLFAAKKLHGMQGNFKLITLNFLCCVHKTLQNVSIFCFCFSLHRCIQYFRTGRWGWKEDSNWFRSSILKTKGKICWDQMPDLRELFVCYAVTFSSFLSSWLASTWWMLFNITCLFSSVMEILPLRTSVEHFQSSSAAC